MLLVFGLGSCSMFYPFLLLVRHVCVSVFAACFGGDSQRRKTLAQVFISYIFMLFPIRSLAPAFEGMEGDIET